MDRGTHLKELGLPSTASYEEIRRAYYGLALCYHPDKVVDVSKKAEAQVKLNAIQAAYDALRGKPTKSGPVPQHPTVPKPRPTRPSPQRSSDWHVGPSEDANAASLDDMSPMPKETSNLDAAAFVSMPPLPEEIFSPEEGYSANADYEPEDDSNQPAQHSVLEKPAVTFEPRSQKSTSDQITSTKRKADAASSGLYYKSPKKVCNGLGLGSAEQHGGYELFSPQVNSKAQAEPEVIYKTEIETDKEKMLALYEKDPETKAAARGGQTASERNAVETLDDFAENDEPLDIDSEEEGDENRG
ncbi:hypothetical protein EJ08DRAFT_730983 [Tothia fuscella]|uniref:J domain-containing protein n=1 Tax=Tothia fuscella TaxID=1048955 RepID=A0A9P4NXN1_9PEZI|nr:hypothetical protein EJ08DRAFT_730983 [Tothia fuscella]